MIATRTRMLVGPDSHGEPVPLDLLDQLEYVPGFKYEIIDGRWEVAPSAGVPEQSLERWLRRKLERYADNNPTVVGWVVNKCRVFIPERPELTVPEPDLGLYHENLDEVEEWDTVSPFLVVEVLVDGDPRKDLVRNVELYFEVPSIAEYWVLDGRDNARQPKLIAHRRWGSRWVIRETPYGDTYTTRTLPGYSLLIDPRQ